MYVEVYTAENSYSHYHFDNFVCCMIVVNVDTFTHAWAHSQNILLMESDKRTSVEQKISQPSGTTISTPLQQLMARVCANTLEGNIKGTHQQHGLGISLHLHSRVIKPPPSEVHHKPFQIQSFKDCWKYVVTCRFHGTYHELSSQLGNGSYASWSQANVASASEVISWIHQWWPTKTSSDILSNYSNSIGSEPSLAMLKGGYGEPMNLSYKFGESQAPVWQSWEELSGW